VRCFSGNSELSMDLHQLWDDAAGIPTPGRTVRKQVQVIVKMLGPDWAAPGRGAGGEKCQIRTHAPRKIAETSSALANFSRLTRSSRLRL
jgi:hypothetical protein